MEKIRVFLTDDSMVIRRLLAQVLSENPNIEVVGQAANGKLAIEQLPTIKPDVMILDIEMPEMNGIETLRELRKRGIRLPIIMFSTLTEKGATITLEALSLGASDYVSKPANVGSVGESMAKVRDELVPKIQGLFLGGKARALATATATAQAAPTPARAARVERIDVVAIGSSTGGPPALTQVLTALPENFPVPIVVTQHMPAVFTKQLAVRLQSESKLKVHEATSGQELEAGNVYLAPGGFHLLLSRQGLNLKTGLDEGPPENSCRPAVDPMFRSIATTFGNRALALVLTGMGVDGLEGSKAIIQQGGSVIVQDEDTSVVWGMPGAIAKAGLATKQLAIQDIGRELVAMTSIGRTTSAG